ncbi:MAG: DNA polymerase III subunit delta' [Pseudomonadota bacterium]
MMDAPYPWQQAHWERLQAARHQGRLAHAYLLNGPVGVGKRDFAEALAQSFLCRVPESGGRGCRTCPDCRQVAAGSHPEFTRVVPDADSKSGEIRIDAIRDLLDGVALTILPGRLRVLILDPADRLNRAAANALLKTLEEPIPGVLWLLIATRMGGLPATVKSRCQRLSFTLPPQPLAQAWLATHLSDPSDLAAAGRWLALAGGAPLRALSLRDSDWPEQQVRCLEEFREVLAGHRDPVRVAERWKDLDLGRLTDGLCYWLADALKGTIQAAVDATLGEPARYRRLWLGLMEVRAARDAPLNTPLLLEAWLIRCARQTPENFGAELI